jgi:TolB protein
LPRAVNDVLHKGLERDPDERYTTVEEFRQELLRVLGTTTKRSRLWPVVLLGITVVFLLSLWRSRGDDNPVPEPAERSSSEILIRLLRPVPFGGQDELVYPCTLMGSHDLVLLRPDGGPPRSLLQSEDPILFPAFSPDGRRLAYVSDHAGKLTIYLQNMQTNEVTHLTPSSSNNRLPAWSPDGKHLAFVSDRAGNEDIWIMDTDGSHPVNLTHSPGQHADPAWSPDGKTIAFASCRNKQRGFRVFLMDADGRNVRDVSGKDNRFGFVYPAWSHDGRQLAYGSSVGNAIELFVCDADGSHTKQITKLGGTNTLAAWSRDSSRIVFQHVRSGEEGGALYVMGPDGINPKVILKAGGHGDGGRPCWKWKND